MNKNLRRIVLNMVMLLTSSVYAGQYFESTIMSLKEINDTINSISYKKSTYDSLASYELLKKQVQSLKWIAYQYGQNLEKKAKADLPIKGEDLSIMRALMDSTILVSEKSSHFSAKFRADSMVTEVAIAQYDLVQLMVKADLLAIYQTAYNIFYNNTANKKIAIEVFKMIDNPKQKEVLEKLTQLPQKSSFYTNLQASTNRFLENRYYYLKFLNPTLTKTVVMLEKMDLAETVLNKPIPKLQFVSTGSWFIEIWNRTTNFVSGVFGNLVGAIRFRHGYMHEHKASIQRLYNTLKPLDIIAEKTPFAATDFFIPGHFGHIAIYLGTEEQLKDYGLWHLPLVQKYKHLIRQGKTIIESIRPGSRMVSIEDFLEIDEITIIRDEAIHGRPWQSEKTATVALEQLWKDYDFNFDIATLDKVVCSEVPYHAFGYKRWQTSYIFGRHTISPDEIIENAFTQGSGVKFVASFKVNKNKNIIEVSKHAMAKNLDFSFDSSKNLFTKEEKKCRLVKLNQYTNIHAVRYYKKCTKYDKPLIYSDL